METRENIIRIALSAFCKKGYEKVALSEIAREAGIAKPSLYHHFKGKEALFIEAINYFFQLWGKWTATVLKQENSLKESIYEMLTSYDKIEEELKQIVGNEKDARFGVYYLIFDAIRHIPGFADFYTKTNEEAGSIIMQKITEAKQQGEIREDIDWLSLYYAMGAILEGGNVMKILSPDLDLNDFGKRCFDILWRGIAK